MFKFKKYIPEYNMECRNAVDLEKFPDDWTLFRQKKRKRMSSFVISRPMLNHTKIIMHKLQSK